ncbi:camp-dependent protein kinase catalytic subunit [Cladochytrium tenue]|nr:camp-dependent protein kinase catalytic subunit [Cladochytrium tenue]
MSGSSSTSAAARGRLKPITTPRRRTSGSSDDSESDRRAAQSRRDARLAGGAAPSPQHPAAAVALARRRSSTSSSTSSRRSSLAVSRQGSTSPPPSVGTPRLSPLRPVPPPILQVTPKPLISAHHPTPPTTPSSFGPALPTTPGRLRGLAAYDIVAQIGRGAFASVHVVRLRPDAAAAAGLPSGAVYAIKTLRKHDVVATGQVRHVLHEKGLLATLGGLSSATAAAAGSAIAAIAARRRSVGVTSSVQSAASVSAAATSSHPDGSRFVVRLIETFQDTRHLYLVLEYVAGGDLWSHIRRYGRFLEDEARFYISEIVLALEYIHSYGIIYRDLKPENILVTTSGHLKITDFGFSKPLHRDGVDGVATTFCGTPAYMAPEVILRRPYTTAVDWWSAGIVAYELMAGYTPFQADSPLQIYERIVEDSGVLDVDWGDEGEGGDGENESVAGEHGRNHPGRGHSDDDDDNDEDDDGNDDDDISDYSNSGGDGEGHQPRERRKTRSPKLRRRNRRRPSSPAMHWSSQIRGAARSFLAGLLNPDPRCRLGAPGPVAAAQATSSKASTLRRASMVATLPSTTAPSFSSSSPFSSPSSVAATASGGARAVRAHPWLNAATVDWSELRAGRALPPYLPDVGADAADVGCFEAGPPDRSLLAARAGGDPTLPPRADNDGMFDSYFRDF